MAIRVLDITSSSNIQSAAWNDETLELEVSFHSGARGAYLRVSAEEAEAFEQADSPGKYLHDYLKTRYPWVRK